MGFRLTNRSVVQNMNYSIFQNDFFCAGMAKRADEAGKAKLTASFLRASAVEDSLDGMAVNSNIFEF